MKIKKNVLCLIALLLSLVSCKQNGNESEIDLSNNLDDNVVKVFVMCGQSNMEGNTKLDNFETFCEDSNRDYNDFQFGFSQIQISYWTDKATNGNYSNVKDPMLGKFRKVRLGQGFLPNYFGPELGIAERLNEHLTENDNPVYLIKFTRGASGLANAHEWLPISSGGENNLFTKMVEFVHNNLALLKQENLIPEIRGFLWMQGETDSAGNYMTDEYEENTKNLIGDFRNEFADYAKDKDKENIAFIDAAISELSIWKAQMAINIAKKNVSDLSEHNYYIETRGNGLGLKIGDDEHGGGDLYHYTIDSMIKLGNAFADVIIDNNLLS
ncbi:MAG: sialate O-acetylesterase [Erysipelotrichaceae bacterium]|nr:sialate O-acetylesterase [Erysipelotrichaceae bacterium]